MSAAKKKGTAGEREFAAMFGGKRVPLSGAIPGDPDVKLPPPFDGLHVEVKRRARLPHLVTSALTQAEQSKKAIGNLKFPMMAMREDHGRWIVAMWAPDFREFVKALSEGGGTYQLKQTLRQIERAARDAREAL